MREVVWALSSCCFISSLISTPALTSLLTPSLHIILPCLTRMCLLLVQCVHYIHVSIVNPSGMWEMIQTITQMMYNDDYDHVLPDPLAITGLKIYAKLNNLFVLIKKNWCNFSKWKAKVCLVNVLLFRVNKPISCDPVITPLSTISAATYS